MANSSKTFLLRITGESCWPQLVPGRTYQARRIGLDDMIQVGDFVVFSQPNDPSRRLVKRVVRDLANESYLVAGTVSWSSTWEVPRTAILGIITP